MQPVVDDGLRFATLICTELVVSPAPRALGPDGDFLAATDAANPIVTVKAGLAGADAAKRTYPRNVEE